VPGRGRGGSRREHHSAYDDGVEDPQPCV
jgi:hypothetical protein